MGNSLQDQLVKAGLVDRQKAKQVNSQKRKQTKQQHRGQAQQSDRVGRQVQQAQAQKATQDRELNRRRQEAAQRKAVAAQIRQLIGQNRVPRDQGEQPYHFTHGNKVKKIYLTPQLQAQLIAGSLAVVTLDGRYELVPDAVAEKIRARDPSRVVYRAADAAAAETDKAEPDDPYADYKVPDDLMW